MTGRRTYHRLGLWLIVTGLLMAACTDSYEQRLRQLYQLQADNRADSLMTNDTLAFVLPSVNGLCNVYVSSDG